MHLRKVSELSEEEHPVTRLSIVDDEGKEIDTFHVAHINKTPESFLRFVAEDYENERILTLKFYEQGVKPGPLPEDMPSDDFIGTLVGFSFKDRASVDHFIKGFEAYRDFHFPEQT